MVGDVCVMFVTRLVLRSISGRCPGGAGLVLCLQIATCKGEREGGTCVVSVGKTVVTIWRDCGRASE